MTQEFVQSVMQTDVLAEPIAVVDGLLPDPHTYRVDVLRLPFQTVRDGETCFHGIASLDVATDPVAALIRDRYPTARPHLSFLRKSPQGQLEPNFIHADDGMGEWTGILYLNSEPARGDGTDFWRFRETGEVAGRWRNRPTDAAAWERWFHCDAVFNRLVLFDATLFHSRALFENYGLDERARLIQVVCGTWAR
jgi:hypothetical protein